MKTYKLSYSLPDVGTRHEWLSSELNVSKRRTQLKREYKGVAMQVLGVVEVDVPTKKNDLLKFLNDVSNMAMASAD